MTALLEVRNLRKRFGGIRALDDVSLEVRANEAVGLIGPNGAGKTTLFDCISGVQRADRGRVDLAGERIDDLGVYRRARLGIGRTFQRLELFSAMTAREHMLVAERERRGDGSLLKDLLWKGAPRRDEIARVDELLDELGLEELADAPIESLSLGQGRLVELGRALMRGPRLLLLDEPSSGLDSLESARLAALLRDICERRQIATLVVEHDLELVHSLAQRVYVMDFGSIIGAGTLEDVLGESSVRRAYLGDEV
ncbi:MAG: ATP-binding cassette domain-containing protein [Actinomycetota bacterium]|nr:ATP-binding cassette domain-containing protein [Actinomycetota bacterium]